MNTPLIDAISKEIFEDGQTVGLSASLPGAILLLVMSPFLFGTWLYRFQRKVSPVELAKMAELAQPHEKELFCVVARDFERVRGHHLRKLRADLWANTARIQMDEAIRTLQACK